MAQQDDDWKFTGIRVIPAGSLELDTMKMTAGMDRAVAIDSRVGAQKIWAGTVTIQANAKTGAHHHGALGGVIYIIGATPACAGAIDSDSPPRQAGDFIFVPPYVPHQEINASADETLECVLVRSDNGPWW